MLLAPSLLDPVLGCVLSVAELYDLPSWTGPTNSNKRFSITISGDGILTQTGLSYISSAINLTIFNDSGTNRFRHWTRTIDAAGDQATNTEATPAVLNNRSSGVVGASINGRPNVFHARFGGVDERWYDDSGAIRAWDIPDGDPDDTLDEVAYRHTMARGGNTFSIGGTTATYIYRWIDGDSPATDPTSKRLITNNAPTAATYIAGVSDTHIYIMREGDIDESGTKYELLKILISDMSLTATYTSPQIIGTYSIRSAGVFCDRFWMLPDAGDNVEIFDLDNSLNELYSVDHGNFANCYLVSDTHVVNTAVSDGTLFRFAIA